MTTDRHILLRVVVNLCRLLVALTFIFSGFVKAVDPMGTVYKLQDYLTAFHLPGHFGEQFLIAVAVGLSTLEFCLGVFLLIGVYKRVTLKCAGVFMILMTLLTLYIAIFNPVSDCGCFGDAVKLSNWNTFFKNILLLAALVLAYRYRSLLYQLVSTKTRWIFLLVPLLFIVLLSCHCLRHLPILDFRPYKVGTRVSQAMDLPQGGKIPVVESTYVYQKDGEVREFTLDALPDSTWTFVEAKRQITDEPYVPPIHDFFIEDPVTGDNLTDSILSDTSYCFLLVMPHTETANQHAEGRLNALYRYCQDQGYNFYALTASGQEAREAWRTYTGAEYPICTADETTLKTMVRSNPGLMLLHDGVVYNKWSAVDIPEAPAEGQGLDRSSLGRMKDTGAIRMLGRLIFAMIALLLAVILADRIGNYLWKRYKKQTLKHKIMRKKMVAGNWKMNKNLQEGIELAKELKQLLAADQPNCEVVVCTPFIHLAPVAEVLKGTAIGLGAQNCADKEKGAYTGEVSAEMVKSTGAGYVILGHSERREYYKETPELLKEKVQLALANGLKVIFCIGESLAEREANKQNEVVKAELEGSVFNLTAEEFKNIVIAYEPIWAIGTGKTATAEQAEEIHAYIRSCVAKNYNQEVADNTTILYGGSCKPGNAPELFAKPDIDGGLIGGASLKAADFKGIIDAWKK